jgi:hypothetical protein
MERPRTVAEAVYLEDHAGEWFCYACLRSLANRNQAAEQTLHGRSANRQFQFCRGVCSNCRCPAMVMCDALIADKS